MNNTTTLEGITTWMSGSSSITTSSTTEKPVHHITSTLSPKCVNISLSQSLSSASASANDGITRVQKIRDIHPKVNHDDGDTLIPYLPIHYEDSISIDKTTEFHDFKVPNSISPRLPINLKTTDEEEDYLPFAIDHSEVSNDSNSEDVSFNLINIDHTLPSNRQNAISQLGDSEYKQVQRTSSTIFHDELLPVSQYEANPNFENETKINKNTLENETHPVSATYDDEIISNCNISPDILGCSEDSMYYKNTFSTLFEQADNTSSSAHGLSSSSQSLLLDTNIPTATINHTQNTAISSTQTLPKKCENNLVLSTNNRTTASELMSKSTSQHLRTNGNLDNIRVHTIDSHCFQVIVPIYKDASVMDIVDILANPYLLPCWYDPISSIVVTEEKGGSSPSPTNSLIVEAEHHTTYPSEIDNTEGDVIIGSASQEILRNKQKRENHDGIWIEATTPPLVNPPAHQYMVQECLNSSLERIGCPTLGTVSLFVERRQAHVNLSVGPFNKGAILSHDFSIQQLENDSEPQSSSNILLVDMVTIERRGDGAYNSWDGMYCSMFTTIKEIMDQWFLPSASGYIDQTISSMKKLRAIIDSGGDFAAYKLEKTKRMKSVQDYDSLHEPLLLNKV